jgi:hypothetical protein
MERWHTYHLGPYEAVPGPIPGRVCDFSAICINPDFLRYPTDLSFLKTTAIEREKVTKLTDELTTLQSQYSQTQAQLDAMRTQCETIRAQLGKQSLPTICHNFPHST